MILSGGITGSDVTHLGIFNIPIIANIPNIVYLAPTTAEEYLAMMEWGIDQNKYPVAIRVPNMEVVYTGEKIEPNFYNRNTYEKTYEGDTIASLGLG